MTMEVPELAESIVSVPASNSLGEGREWYRLGADRRLLPTGLLLVLLLLPSDPSAGDSPSAVQEPSMSPSGCWRPGVISGVELRLRGTSAPILSSRSSVIGGGCLGSGVSGVGTGDVVVLEDDSPPLGPCEGGGDGRR